MEDQQLHTGHSKHEGNKVSRLIYRIVRALFPPKVQRFSGQHLIHIVTAMLVFEVVSRGWRNIDWFFAVWYHGLYGGTVPLLFDFVALLLLLATGMFFRKKVLGWVLIALYSFNIVAIIVERIYYDLVILNSGIYPGIHITYTSNYVLFLLVNIIFYLAICAMISLAKLRVEYGVGKKTLAVIAVVVLLFHLIKTSQHEHEYMLFHLFLR